MTSNASSRSRLRVEAHVASDGREMLELVDAVVDMACEVINWSIRLLHRSRWVKTISLIESVLEKADNLPADGTLRY
jgi:hypothetical protein